MQVLSASGGRAGSGPSRGKWRESERVPTLERVGQGKEEGAGTLEGHGEGSGSAGGAEDLGRPQGPGAGNSTRIPTSVACGGESRGPPATMQGRGWPGSKAPSPAQGLRQGQVLLWREGHRTCSARGGDTQWAACRPRAWPFPLLFLLRADAPRGSPGALPGLPGVRAGPKFVPFWPPPHLWPRSDKKPVLFASLWVW